MSYVQAMLPLLSQLMLLAVLFSVLFGRYIKEQTPRLAVLAVVLVLGFFVPLADASAAQWLRSIVGDMSVLTLVLLADILARRLGNHALLAQQTRTALLLGAGLVGVVFYPLALGVGSFDPYRLGFAPLLLAAVLVVLSIIAWLRGARGLAVILLLPLLAFNLHLLEADNLWNYLLDPVLVIYALVQSVMESLRAKRRVRS